MRSTLLVLLISMLPMSAQEVTVAVSEITIEKIPGAPRERQFKSSAKDTDFVIDLRALEDRSSTAFHDLRASAIARYSITSRELQRDGHAFVSADHLLYQCNVGGVDLVVIERSHASPNPLYWFAALSGHPIQFSEIWVYSFDDSGVSRSRRLVAGSRAANCLAVIYENRQNPK
jgi:hypothetical protein